MKKWLLIDTLDAKALGRYALKREAEAEKSKAGPWRCLWLKVIKDET